MISRLRCLETLSAIRGAPPTRAYSTKDQNIRSNLRQGLAQN
jgi:hypothetical protein